MEDFYTDVQLFKGDVFFRGYLNGSRYQSRIKCKPFLFTSCQKEKSNFKTLDDLPVKRVDFDSVVEFKSYIKEYGDLDGFEIYGALSNLQYPWINDKYPGEVGYNVKTIKIANIDIEVSPDGPGFPHAELAEHPVTAITIGLNDNKYKVFGFGQGSFDKNLISKDELDIPLEDIDYVDCLSEKELLKEFLLFWREYDADIITGWNIEGFDIPYLFNRITKIGSPEAAKRLSPWNMVHTKEVPDMFGKQKTIHNLIGIAVIDYLPLYKKFRFKNQENYKLDYICSVELNRSKLSYEEYGNLVGLYKDNFQKFITYNIKDVWLVGQLEKKLNFMNQLLSVAYSAKINYQDVFGTVKPWDVLIHNHLMNKGVVVPSKSAFSGSSSIVGGHVKEPIAGMHKWVVTFDLTSLYPSIMRLLNLSPEMMTGIDDWVNIKQEYILNKTLPDEITEKMAVENLSLSCNGLFWKREKQGFIPEIVTKMFKERVFYKKKMLVAKQDLERLKAAGADKKTLTEKEIEISHANNKQMSLKIFLNSGYGAVANKYFRFFSAEMAEAITMTGQVIIKWVEKSMNEYLNKIMKTDKFVDYLVAGDTDSVMLNLGPLVKKMGIENKSDGEITDILDKICKDKLEKMLVVKFDEFSDYLNVFERTLFMKREAIATNGLFLKKKKYILRVCDMEGVRYKNPYLKITGVEAVRSSTPEICRKTLKESIEIIMSGDERRLQKFIADFKVVFFSKRPHEISFPRGCNNISKWELGNGTYKSGTPIAVRAAIVHNKMLEDKNLTSKYNYLGSGEKIKFCYLKVPNMTRGNVIGFDDILPEEFKLDGSVDYEMMFEKAFLAPINTMIDVIGWSTERRATLF